jgi:hypothetical protein
MKKMVSGTNGLKQTELNLLTELNLHLATDTFEIYDYLTTNFLLLMLVVLSSKLFNV